MSTEAQKRAQRKYDKKRLLFSTTFRGEELEIANILKEYLEYNNLSANGYIKGLILDDLKRKGLL